MPHAFIRFVTARIDEHSGRRQGVFQAATSLVEAKELTPHELDELNAIREWFGENLEVPDRFSRNRRRDGAGHAISWHKRSAAEHINRMHAMCRILNEHGVATEMITSDRPGYVVFEDDHQVTAVPFGDTST